MDFGIDPSLADQLDTIAAFVREELVPLEADFLGQPFGQLEPVLDQKRQMVKDRGWWAPHLAASYGGMGLSLLDFAMVAEKLGHSPVAHYVFNCQAPDAGNMEILVDHATDAQRADFLEPLAAGACRSCFAMTEPEFAGSNPTMMATTARRDGDTYVIDGHKWFTSSADGARFAVVMAQTNPDADSRHRRASQLLVPTETPGFDLVRNLPVMGEPGQGYASHAEIKFTDCRVPVQNRLGAEGAGFQIAQQRLGPGRIHHCMRWLGICERAFELMCRRAANRQLYPGTVLGDKQMVQAKIADSRAEIDAARMLVLRTAWQIDRDGQQAARVPISAIKFYVANVLQDVLDRAIQVHGGLGVTDDTPLAYWYRHERAARIYDGPDEVHKAQVAKRELAAYRDSSPD